MSSAGKNLETIGTVGDTRERGVIQGQQRPLRQPTRGEWMETGWNGGVFKEHLHWLERLPVV